MIAAMKAMILHTVGVQVQPARALANRFRVSGTLAAGKQQLSWWHNTMPPQEFPPRFRTLLGFMKRYIGVGGMGFLSLAIEFSVYRHKLGTAPTQ